MESCEYPECGCAEIKEHCEVKPPSNYAILDLPVPLEPVIVDLNRPLSEQLPPGQYLEAAEKMVNEINRRNEPFDYR